MRQPHIGKAQSVGDFLDDLAGVYDGEGENVAGDFLLRARE